MHAPSTPSDLHEQTRRRAEEIYFRNGCIPGHDVENWTQAEKEILEESRPALRTAVVVNVDGVRYVGEYTLDSCRGYHPGEIAPGAPVHLRFEGDKMFLQRPDGGELETTIVQRIG